MSQESQEDPLKAWTTKLPQEIQESLRKLARYEGRPIQEVHAEILRKYFEFIGEIPERKSILDKPWAQLKKKPPSK